MLIGVRQDVQQQIHLLIGLALRDRERFVERPCNDLERPVDTEAGQIALTLKAHWTTRTV